MKTLEIGTRVNVVMVKTESWHSDRFIKNGVLTRYNSYGIPVVSIDDKSDHSIGFTGGCLYQTAYQISEI